MLKAIVTIDGQDYECEVEDVQVFGLGQKLALVKTLDGSKPFMAHVARSDPEETPVPAYIPATWGWVDINAIKSAEVTNDALVRNLGPAFDVAGYGMPDDTRSDLGL